jgi:hypothetical protein
MLHSFIFDVNETDFSEKVLEASHQQPVLVDFWADWCPPCRFLTPVLEKATQGYRGEVLLAKVEVDDNSAGSGIGRALARPQGEPQGCGELQHAPRWALPVAWLSHRHFVHPGGGSRSFQRRPVGAAGAHIYFRTCARLLVTGCGCLREATRF